MREVGFKTLLRGKIRNISSAARYSLYGLTLTLYGAVFAVSCGGVKYIPVQDNSKVEYRDSIITYLDTVEVIRKEVEKVRDFTGLTDSLFLETKSAKAVAWIDTNSVTPVLKGTLEDKPIPIRVVVPREEEYHLSDSVTVKEIPVRVEVEKKVIPKWCWYSLIVNILGLMLGAFVLYLRIKGKFLKG